MHRWAGRGKSGNRSGLTRTLQLTRPSVAALLRGLAAERQSLGRRDILAAVASEVPTGRAALTGFVANGK